MIGNTTGLTEARILPSVVSTIDPDQGISYANLELKDIYSKFDFNETVFLLWNQRPPTASEKNAFLERKKTYGTLAPFVIKSIESTPEQMSSCEALQSLIPYIQLSLEQETDLKNWQDQALFFIAQVESILIHLFNRKEEEKCLTFDIAEPLVSRLLNKPTDKNVQKCFEKVRNLYAEHELNAATFACRVAASTGVNLGGAISAALGTLKGPIHGGAVEGVAELYKLTSASDIKEYVKSKRAKKEKIMGFGHRVYMKTGDPRYLMMKNVLKELCDIQENPTHFNICTQLETTTLENIGIKPNLDLAGAACFLQLGFDVEKFVALIAMSRIAGWCAHFQEQRLLNKIIRPRAFYSSELLEKTQNFTSRPLEQ